MQFWSKYVALLVAVHAGTSVCEPMVPVYLNPQIAHAVVPYPPLRLAPIPVHRVELPAAHSAPRPPMHIAHTEKSVRAAPKHMSGDPAPRLNVAHVQSIPAHSVVPKTRMAKHETTGSNDSDTYSVSKPRNGNIGRGPNNVIEHGPLPRIRDAPVPRIRDAPVPRIRDAPVPRIRDAPVPRIHDAPWPIVPADEAESSVDNWPVASASGDDVAESPSDKTGSGLRPMQDVRKPVTKSQSAKGAVRTARVADKVVNKARVDNTSSKQLRSSDVMSEAPSAVVSSAMAMASSSAVAMASSVVAMAAPTITVSAVPSTIASTAPTSMATSAVATASMAPTDTDARNSTAGMGDIPSVNRIMRMAESNMAGMQAQDVLGDIRNNPSMGYHGHKLIRGVNIGGFLVPEFWITPSLVADIADPKPSDYLELCHRLGPDATLRLMRAHWESWVTEAEVQRLAGAGLTHLRVPIGHWEFVDSDEGYVRGGLPYFKRLVYWAHKYGLQVIADMHTAPGSQNGFDNSGSTQGVNWTSDPKNVALSKRALQTMLKYIASDPVVLATIDAIDLLNEPLIDALDFEQLWEYDTGGHTLVTQGLHKTPPVVSIVDRGFKDYSWWQPRWPRDWNSKYIDAWLDAHLYHVFDRNIDAWPLESHLRLVAQNGRDLKSNSTVFPILVGEWSLALPQTAVNGRENQARRMFAEAQLDAYELGGAGWVFWCFKTEASPEWSFLDALDRSWIPQPLNTREFPAVSHY
ncbi:hypothetical protein GGH12_003697 [Coemansia sp. RSA 1822]|nr:hypothetical protein GGH12_003697 [Coemansia sp. RSA 1822]